MLIALRDVKCVILSWQIYLHDNLDTQQNQRY